MEGADARKKLDYLLGADNQADQMYRGSNSERTLCIDELEQVPRKFATIPELPVLNELDEHENLSNSLPKTKRCGVSLKYHSENEAQKTRPAVEEHSTNQSITNDFLEKLYKDNPKLNLADCLEIDEDCGNITGEVTQNSDVLENMPVEKVVRHKKISIKRNAKSIVQDEPAIDESDVVGIEDTRFKQSSKAVPKLNTRKIAAKNDKDPIDTGKSNVLVESKNTSSQIKSTKATLTRKRRKLYSPKDDQNENKEIPTPKTREERRQSNVNLTPILTCYRELENARQSRRISRKARANTQTKRSKKSRYSMYSDGEDPTFQIRERDVSLSSIASTMRARGRALTPVKYLQENYTTLSSSEEETKRTRRITPRRRKSSSKEANLLQKFKKNYTDVHDLNQTDDTGHLLLNADENDDVVLEPTEIIETALVSDVISERSIATGGRSPITGHDDLNQSPPNVELLDEVFQHRDMHNEDMAEFYTNIRNQLQTNKPTASQTSRVIPCTTISKPKIVLQRLSSHEINEWRRTPNFKDTDTDQKLKKYDSRQTSQLTEIKIPAKVIKKKIKPKLSLVKLNIDKSSDSSVTKAQTSKNDPSFSKSSHETSKSSAVTKSKPDKAPASVDRCGVNRSIASVHDSTGDNHARREMLRQMMEAFQTKLHQATGERLAAAFAKDHEEIACLLKKEVPEMISAAMELVNIRVEEKIAELKKNQMERACQVIRADAEDRARMMNLLHEDIQRILN